MVAAHLATEALSAAIQLEKIPGIEPGRMQPVINFWYSLADHARIAALAEQHVAEAHNKAEEEHVKRLELEASIKPRRLTAEPNNELTPVLKPFAAAPMNLEWVGPGGQASPQTCK